MPHIPTHIFLYKAKVYLSRGLLGFLVLAYGHVHSQSYCWVYFKGEKEAGQAVDSRYLKKLGNCKVSLVGTSKWFNAAFIEVKSEHALKKVRKLKCVRALEPGLHYQISPLSLQADSLEYGQADLQLKMLGLNDYHNKGYTGKGVTIGLFDGGFFRVDSIGAFSNLRDRKGIKAAKDFYDNNTNVYDDDAHGMHVLSLIAGFKKDSMQGAAPDANFLLARTEFVATEKHIEEFNWVRALEWADSIGVDIIHSSLGYSQFDSLEGDYKYQDMDGKSTIVTRAAEMAFARGIFITNSAGNEGRKPWRYITAPCDGPNVLCVGAVDSFEKHADFSSYGPSADGRVKPDVMAMGHKVSIISKNNTMRRGSGTSFSGPIIAGFVACLKQAFPAVSNKILLEAIRKSAHLYTHPNDSMGYGIPNILKADSLVRRKLSIKDTQLKTLVGYPNPCRSIFTLTNLPFNEKIEMFDLYGKRFEMESENGQVDLSGFSDGIYLIKVSHYEVLKVIKE